MILKDAQKSSQFAIIFSRQRHAVYVCAPTLERQYVGRLVSCSLTIGGEVMEAESFKLEGFIVLAREKE